MVEKAEDKLVQATVDGLDRYGMLLSAAEDRWAQKLEALETELSQQRDLLANQGVQSHAGDLAMLDERFQTLAQRLEDTLVQATVDALRKHQANLQSVEDRWAHKIAMVEEEVSQLAQSAANPNEYASMDALRTSGLSSSAGDAESDAMAQILKPISSSTAADNDQLRLAILGLVDKMNANLVGAANVNADIEEMRDILASVSNALMLDLQRLRRQQNLLYGEMNSRMGEVEQLQGLCSKPPLVSEDGETYDDCKFVEDAIGMVRQMQLKGRRNVALPEPETFQALRASGAFQPINDRSQDEGNQLLQDSMNSSPRQDARDVEQIITLLQARLKAPRGTGSMMISADDDADVDDKGQCMAVAQYMNSGAARKVIVSSVPTPTNVSGVGFLDADPVGSEYSEPVSTITKLKEITEGRDTSKRGR